MDHEVKCKWEGGMLFSAETPGGNVKMSSAGEGGLGPKALMLDALVGCTGLDVSSLITKMRLEVEDIQINAGANLTEDHPRTYKEVVVDYIFKGANLNHEKLNRIVEMSSEKYCGVMAMFREFSEVKINVHFEDK